MLGSSQVFSPATGVYSIFEDRTTHFPFGVSKYLFIGLSYDSFLSLYFFGFLKSLTLDTSSTDNPQVSVVTLVLGLVSGITDNFDEPKFLIILIRSFLLYFFPLWDPTNDDLIGRECSIGTMDLNLLGLELSGMIILLESINLLESSWGR